jgi:hypothetical protein
MISVMLRPIYPRGKEPRAHSQWEGGCLDPSSSVKAMAKRHLHALDGNWTLAIHPEELGCTTYGTRDTCGPQICLCGNIVSFPEIYIYIYIYIYTDISLVYKSLGESFEENWKMW